jgi:hypothetical protein
MYTDPTGHARGDWWDFSYFGENFKAVWDFMTSSDEERDSTIVNIRHDDDESISNPVVVTAGQIFNGIAKIGSAATTVSKAKTLGEKEAVAVGASQSILDNFVVMPAIYLQYCADTLFLGQDYADRHYSETMQNRNTFENTVKEYAVVNDSENVDKIYNASRLLTDTTITTVGTIKLGLDANKFVQNIAKGSPWDTTPKAAVAGSNATVDYSNFYRDLYKSKPNVVQASGDAVNNNVRNASNSGVGGGNKYTLNKNFQGKFTAKGTGKVVNSVNKTRVGQWMSKAEYEQFVKTGEIPRTNVLTKGKEGYIKQANSGDYYVEFDVDSSLLVTKNDELGWSLVKSKNDMYLKLAAKKGETLPAAIGENITHVSTK